MARGGLEPAVEVERGVLFGSRQWAFRRGHLLRGSITYEVVPDDAEVESSTRGASLRTAA